MPTKKPTVQIVLDQEIYDKMSNIAKEQKRSVSNLGAYIISDWIEQKEKNSIFPENLNPFG